MKIKFMVYLNGHDNPSRRLTKDANEKGFIGGVFQSENKIKIDAIHLGEITGTAYVFVSTVAQ